MPVVFPFRRLDALVIFDDVFVPWESVFVYRGIDVVCGQLVVAGAPHGEHRAILHLVCTETLGAILDGLGVKRVARLPR